MSTRSTVPEKLLIAAYELHKRKNPTFTAEDLVVAAWERFPDAFGLSGYADRFPDSNRVLVNIMGTKGMRGKGWLRKVGEKQYRLTPTALSDAETLSAGTGADEGQTHLRAELDRRASIALERLMGTAAARKSFSGQADTISFYDACGFWDITVRSNANTLVSRLTDTRVLLDRAMALLDNKAVSDGLKIGNMKISREQIQNLKDLSKIMEERFKSDLDILRKRTDERLEKKGRLF